MLHDKEDADFIAMMSGELQDEITEQIKEADNDAN